MPPGQIQELPDDSLDLVFTDRNYHDMPEDRIDLVDIWSAPPLLQHHIAMTGKLLKGNKDDFLGFRVLAWKRYLDTAKLRRAREKKLERLYAD